MKISVTKAAKEWGVSRTTIYQKINDGELSRASDKKIDVSEMLRVFGEAVVQKSTDRSVNTVKKTSTNSQKLQVCTALEHQLALEKLKNEHLQQQVDDQKRLIENYQQQIDQLNKTLAAANASIQDFAQVRLLEFKKSEPDYELQLKRDEVDNSKAETKKRWWGF